MKLRALLAFISSLFFALAFGRWFIGFVAARRVVESSKKGDSERLDQMHAHKENTPTLGGVIVMAGVVFSVAVWARLENRLVLLFLGYMIALFLLGFLDDWKKLKSRRKGLGARAKFLFQAALSLLLGAYLYLFPLEVKLPRAWELASSFRAAPTSPCSWELVSSSWSRWSPRAPPTR